MVLRLCIVVESFCSPVRNIFPRNSLHDLPCHRDHEEMFAPSFSEQGSFSVAPAEILDSNIFL